MYWSHPPLKDKRSHRFQCRSDSGFPVGQRLRGGEWPFGHQVPRRRLCDCGGENGDRGLKTFRKGEVVFANVDSAAYMPIRSG